MEIGECTIPVDFHVVEIKSGKTSSLLFGRAFMATVGAVCDLKKNKICLTNVDERFFYDPVEKNKSTTPESTDENSNTWIDNQHQRAGISFYLVTYALMIYFPPNSG